MDLLLLAKALLQIACVIAAFIVALIIVVAAFSSFKEEFEDDTDIFDEKNKA